MPAGDRSMLAREHGVGAAASMVDHRPDDDGPKRMARLSAMSIAITADHRALADTAADFPAKRVPGRRSGPCLTVPRGASPPSGASSAPGLARAARARGAGGSGYGLPGLLVVVEELGAALTPAPSSPAPWSARCWSPPCLTRLRPACCPDWPTGRTGAFALDGAVTVDGGTAGSAGVVLGGGLADVLLVALGEDVEW